MRHVRSGDSTVDVERRAGDVGGLVTRQEQRSSGHLFSFAKTACTPSTTGTQANAGGSTKRGEAAPTHPWGRAQGGAASSPRCSGTSSAAPFAVVHCTIPRHNVHTVRSEFLPRKGHRSHVRAQRVHSDPLAVDRAMQATHNARQRRVLVRLQDVACQSLSPPTERGSQPTRETWRERRPCWPCMPAAGTGAWSRASTGWHSTPQYATVHAGNTTTCVSHTVAPAGLQRPAGQQRRRC